MSVKASEIAGFLKASLVGEDINVSAPASLREDVPAGRVLFVNGKRPLPDGIGSLGPSLFLIPLDKTDQMPMPHIAVANPRLSFARVLEKFFTPKETPTLHKTACVEEGAIIGDHPHIGAFAHIGPDVIIGNNVVIGSHTVIVGRTYIGDGTIIHSHSVIGEPGFGFEKDEHGIPHRLPHLGGVQIGKNCEISALNTIASGTLDPTILKDYVKTDDHVHIAHNCTIGNRVLIAAAAEISGSVCVEDDVWVGPNASLINGIKIGTGAFIGIGAVVTNDVASNTIMGAVRARAIAANKVAPQ